MDLITNIEQELWDVIEKDYQSENYSGAILDAMHLLTETIRNKTGLEGDGASLVGQAFGGDNPKIQINKLQTESEKNIQKGIQEILKGLYIAVRNPRSHDKLNDTKEDSNSIIYFINYLLNLIDKSKSHFEQSVFLQRIFDEHYVKSKVYSDLLVNEIPKRQRIDIAIAIILKRKDGNIYNFKFFMDSLFEKLEEHEIIRLYKVISDELTHTSQDEDIRTILHICPATYWNKINKVVKIRIENIIKKDVKSGKYNSEKGMCNEHGCLGTWVEAEHLKKFEDLNEWTNLVIAKSEKVEKEDRDYIDKYFWKHMWKANRDNICLRLEYYIKNGLKNKNEKIVNELKNEIIFDENHPWWIVFEEELIQYPEIVPIDLEDLDW
ncbi:MAG: TIGR02391 family protein [Syntrophomonadaceae bacterium]|nr:TIGR02391 family protein [Syntrophomonadaceae bacterium]